MKRREFIGKLSAGVLAGTALAACKSEEQTNGEQAAVVKSGQVLKWKMVTTWPKNFPVLGTGAELLARLIGEMSGGRLQIKVYGANELVPAFEIFDFVAEGGAEMGHGSAYYWKGKNEAFQFFSTVPFGLSGDEINAWIFHGGGMELWQEAYAPFGLVPAAAGNTGVQMAGWFNKEINSLADLKGLKMRIPGLGGEVLKRAGGTPVNLAGGELFTALETGAIDATEWVGPYNDLAFGLYQAAKYYYYPGWHEPGTILECFINQKALNALPQDLQMIVQQACRIANQDMQVEYIARNNAALQTLKTEHNVNVRRLPDDVLIKLKAIAEEVVQEIAAKDRFAAKVYASYKKFYQQALAWSDVSERAYLNARVLGG